MELFTKDWHRICQSCCLVIHSRRRERSYVGPSSFDQDLDILDSRFRTTDNHQSLKLCDCLEYSIYKNRQTYRVSIICHKLGAGMAPPGLVHRCQVFDKAGLWVLCHCAYSSITRWVPTARNNIFISNLHPTGFPVIDWWLTYDICSLYIFTS